MSRRNARAAQPGLRGWPGRGGGATGHLEIPPEWRGTTVQVCGLWPYAVGAGAPLVGAPLGRRYPSGEVVAADPIAWFQAGLIPNPSITVLSLPGLGKSTLVRRMLLGVEHRGIMPLVLGDLKPDYVDLIERLDGQVIRGGELNILDPGEVTDAAQRLRAAGHQTAAQELEADAHSRRINMVLALVTILRHQAPSDREATVLDRALRILDERHRGVPVLGDLLHVIQHPPDELRAVALDRGDFQRYQSLTEDLEASLISLTMGGRLGTAFSKATKNPMRRDRPVVYDVSGIEDTDKDRQAATLMACWSNGFGTINVAHALADAGLEPRRNYFVALDELWRALRIGYGMPDRVDELTRLNRSYGVGQAMIWHTMQDLQTVPTEEDRRKAAGFVERAGMVALGGLPHGEMPFLRTAKGLSRAEEAMLESWQDPPSWDPKRRREAAPAGLGRFLIKVSGRPGIPVEVQLTAAESQVHDTNKRWHMSQESVS